MQPSNGERPFRVARLVMISGFATVFRHMPIMMKRLMLGAFVLYHFFSRWLERFSIAAFHEIFAAAGVFYTGAFAAGDVGGAK